MKMPDHLKKAYKAARKDGWEVSFTRSGHIKWKRPDGAISITSSTGSCRRGSISELARLKRMGLPL